MQETFKKTVAVAVPWYKEKLSEAEEISLRHLLHFLGGYDKFIVAPANLKINQPDFTVKTFPTRFFKNTKSYSRLLLTKDFYRQFSDYEYILIYQLDALVFSDQLNYWCAAGYDYIGAPWFKEKMIKKYDYPGDACGNGGFSLRKVASFIKVIDLAKLPWYIVLSGLIAALPDVFKSAGLKEGLKKIKQVWLNSAAQRTPLNEDRYWSFIAPTIDPGFKISPVEVGLKFAFEIAPSYCYQRNNRQLPFGAHAWERYDKDFWLPYLLK
ncbi:MAG: DUF5672 family protein [Candidatus Komeilibacteria bacterium]|nr:DUF5672 family protein [Candidatus Komeilibacteria bacterium]